VIRAKKHRLPDAAYYGQRTVSITACTEHRKPFLVEPEIFAAMMATLREVTQKYRCLVPVYCFMPDHVHMLVQGRETTSRPKQAVDDFKGISGLWLEVNQPQYEWQEGYYDHILRSDDDWRRQAFYIFQNPVRKGLIIDPYEYPFTGSIGYDLQTLFADLAL